MSCPDEAKLRDVFCKADLNGDGKVTPGELRNMVVNEFGADLSDRDVAEMFCCLDKNQDGTIELNEFLGEMMKKPRRAEFRKMFKSIDRDNSGCISKDEIRQFLRSQGFPDQDIEKMFSKVDTNNDGTISENEFMAMA